jgi:hypothetical protein
MNKTLFAIGVILTGLSSVYAASPVTRQPAITAEDLSWFSGIQYVKGSFDSSDPQRPRTLRLILQKQGADDVVLLPELRIPDADHEKDFSTEFLFVSSKQPDDKHKLFIGASNHSGRVHFSRVIDAFSPCKVVCVHYFNEYKLTKGKHVLLYGDGGEGAVDPESQDFKVRLILDVM